MAEQSIWEKIPKLGNSNVIEVPSKLKINDTLKQGTFINILHYHGSNFGLTEEIILDQHVEVIEAKETDERRSRIVYGWISLPSGGIRLFRAKISKLTLV